MNQFKLYIIICILNFAAVSVSSQGLCDTLPFINCDLNEIVYSENDSNINTLIQKINTLKSDKNQSLQIVHIGDSHLQAGFLTEKIKQQLFTQFSTDSFAAPGFIFPYTIAETNNPFFFKVNYTGNWEWCKNVDTEKICKLGLSGITVQTKDTATTISIKMQNSKYDYPAKYYFNKIKILHNSEEEEEVIIQINNKKAETFGGYSIIELPALEDSVFIEINQPENSQFELYGIFLENTMSQINYHTIGVNGATAQSYLQCDYFSSHLELINPNLIIISLGTNEAYDTDFRKTEHEYILRDLIYQIRDVSPNAAIILVTANDHLKNRKYLNPNIQDVNDNILKVCKEFKLNYWDFYAIMGGEKSIMEWYEKSLSGEDKLHFKRAGYEIQGELFFNALIKLTESNTENNPLLLGGVRGGNKK
jgi:lysophospholipase L1-like esterase